MGNILSVGLNLSLLLDRELALAPTGAEVTSSRVEPALLLLENQFYDVVVLCHTLLPSDLSQLCRVIELFWPVSRILALCRDAPRPSFVNESVPRWQHHSREMAQAASLVEVVGRLLMQPELHRQQQPFLFSVETDAATSPVAIADYAL